MSQAKMSRRQVRKNALRERTLEEETVDPDCKEPKQGAVSLIRCTCSVTVSSSGELRSSPTDFLPPRRSPHIFSLPPNRQVVSVSAVNGGGCLH